MAELRVSDWHRSVAWYRDALGLPVEMLDEARKFALLGGDGGRVALKGGEDAPVTARFRLSFLAEDLENSRRRLMDHGAPCGAIVTDSHEGFRSFRVFDPDLVPIQVFCWTA